MPEIVYIYSQNSAINFLKVIKDYQLRNPMDEYQFNVYWRKNLFNFK